MTAKYIKTQDNCIIVFSAALSHSDFKDFNPMSAGFITFNTYHKGQELQCSCYGESVSLGLKSDPGDSMRATQQICSEY